MIKKMPLEEFLAALASKEPTPGGGSAAAILAAMGASLLSMVGNLTVGKKGYEAVSDETEQLLKRTEALREELINMVADDIDVFNKVMSAYGLPKESEADKATRSQAIQGALEDATDVPLRCAELAAEVIRLSLPMATNGNRNVISDAGVGVLAAHAALRSAALNVFININHIKDEAFKKDRGERLNKALSEMDSLTEEVYALVKSRL